MNLLTFVVGIFVEKMNLFLKGHFMTVCIRLVGFQKPLAFYTKTHQASNFSQEKVIQQALSATSFNLF